ncbi:hypothetical protein ABEB36_000061 [Hypothenemus hampei]|uniref:Uncharacterized protein n=1 Tax=Hypothenemus hampei TaxID=57062 RepID=A0ABD1FAV5_HYPHA
MKISNNKWIILTYKDLSSLKESFQKYNLILNSLYNFIEPVNPCTFHAEVKTHVSLLSQISENIEEKFKDIEFDVTVKSKRGLMNGIGKPSMRLYVDCKLKRQHLMRESIKEIEQNLYNISDTLLFYGAKIKILEIAEQLMASYSYIELMLGDILNSVTFARLNIIHSSIIRPGDFMSQLLYISGNLNRDYLPLSVSTQSIAGYFDITELKAFQTDSRIIFALEIPLVEAENYLMFRLYPIPIKDNNTRLYHILFPSGKKFIARNEDSSKYIIVDSIDE